MMAKKKISVIEAGLFQLRKQTGRFIRAAETRIARYKKIEKEAVTETQRKQARKEQLRTINLTNKMLANTNALLREINSRKNKR